jgi:hypothetical protein
MENQSTVLVDFGDPEQLAKDITEKVKVEISFCWVRLNSEFKRLADEVQAKIDFVKQNR